MRVIITGGTGFIGQALARSLAADKHEVILLTRDPAKQKRTLPGTRLVQWDGRSAAGWGALADGAGAIVNLAGESINQLWTRSAKARILESRVNAGKAVSEAISAATTKPGVLIQSSAVGYYGPRGDELVTEKDSPGTDFLARVVWEWEASTAGVARAGVRRVVIRTGLPLSPEGGVFPLLTLPFRLLIAGGPLGSGRQYVPWLHLEDQVRAIRFLIDHPTAAGTFNLCSPNPVRQKDLAKALGEVMGRPALMPAPGFAMRAVLGQMASLVLEGQRQIPERLVQLGFDFKWPELLPALRDLLKKQGATQKSYHHRFVVNAPLAEVRAFHSRASGMGALTPPPIVVQMQRAPEFLGEGDEMEFTLWMGPLPLRWLARISEVTEYGFLDTQVRGPFQRWEHRHTFTALDANRTEVIDTLAVVPGGNWFWRAVGQSMALSLPLLFAYRQWRTRRLLERGRTVPVASLAPRAE